MIKLEDVLREIRAGVDGFNKYQAEQGSTARAGYPDTVVTTHPTQRAFLSPYPGYRVVDTTPKAPIE